MQVAFNSPFQGTGTTPRCRGRLLLRAATQLFSSFLGEPRTFGVTLRGNSASTGRRRRPMSRRPLRRLRRWSSSRLRRLATAAATAAAARG